MAKGSGPGALVVLQGLDDGLPDLAPDLMQERAPSRLHCAVVDLPHGKFLCLAARTPDDLVARRELFLGMVGG